MARTRSDSFTSPPKTVVLGNQVAAVNGTCTAPYVMGAINNTSYSFTEFSDVRSMTDVETPGFKKIMRSGGIVNSPMTSSRTIISTSSVKVDQSAALQEYTCTPKRWITLLMHERHGEQSFASLGLNLGPALTFTDAEVTTNEEIAITKAHANIDTSEILLLASLAEFPKSIKGLVTSLRSVARTLKKVRKAERLIEKGRRVNQTANVADLYMEARYNLRPMYYDIQGILKALSFKGNQACRQTFRSRRSITKDTEVPGTLNMWSWSGVLSFKLDFVRKDSITNEVRAGVLCQMDQLTNGQVWGLDRIVDTIWELTPFSFIVDWFVNVGDTIASWIPVMGTKTLASWIVSTTTTVQSLEVVGSQVVLTPSYAIRALGANAQYSGLLVKTTVNKKRLPNYARPIIPNVSVKLDPLKLLDLAVITGLIKKTRDSRSFRV